MNATAFAQGLADASPLKVEVSEYNRRLRDFVAVEAHADAANEPLPGTAGDTVAGWAAYARVKAERTARVEAARTALHFAEGRARTAIGRSLTDEERRHGFVVSNVRGWAGAPARPEHFKPGRYRPAPEDRAPLPRAASSSAGPALADFGAVAQVAGR
ncbi:MAG: hypothetical protein L6R43_08790 [Planctomycetes bacterium]|nr:hypothetical protein [Planctomycetota bacterium]